MHTPLATFLMSPLLQPGVFATPTTQPSPIAVQQRAEYLEQQQVLQQLQQSTAHSRLPTSVVLSLHVTSLSFEATPSQAQPIRPMVMRPTSMDSAIITSLAATLALVPESMSVAMEPAMSLAPSTSATPASTQVKTTTSTDSSDDDDPNRYITLSSAAPTSSTP